MAPVSGSFARLFLLHCVIIIVIVIITIITIIIIIIITFQESPLREHICFAIRTTEMFTYTSDFVFARMANIFAL